MSRRIILSCMPIIGCSLLMIQGCGSSVELASYHRDREIVVDGDQHDWNGIPVYVDKSGVAVAVSNDESYLYLCLSTSDRGVEREIMIAGLTVWFDPSGGSDQKLGVRFPLGRPPSAGAMAMPEEGVESSAMAALFVGGEMELLGPGKDERFMTPITSEKEVLVRVNASAGKLVYEMRIPLKSTPGHPFALDVSLGSPVGVGFEAPKIAPGNRSAGDPPGGGGIEAGAGGDMGGDMGGGMGGGMGGEGGGRHRGGGGRGGRGQGSANVEQLKLWTRVHLSSVDNVPRSSLKE